MSAPFRDDLSKTGIDRRISIPKNDGLRKATRKPWELRPAVANVNLTLTRPPSVNEAYRNVPGKGRVYTRKAKDWIEVAAIEIMAQRPGCVRGKYALVLQIERSSERQDGWNYEKLLSDLLVKLGVVEDDRHCSRGEWEWAGRGDRIHARITSHPRAE